MDKVVEPSKRRQLLDVYDDRIEGAFVPEMSGIVNWALSMSFDKMRDVLANPVKHAPSLALSNLDALTVNNTYVSWLDECTLYAPNSVACIGRGAKKPSADEQERGLSVKDAHSDLYPSYVEYCRACGFRPCNKPNFTVRVSETMRNILKLPVGKVVSTPRGMSIEGLRLKPFDLTSNRAASGDTRLPTPKEFSADYQSGNTSRWDKAFEKHDPISTS